MQQNTRKTSEKRLFPSWEVYKEGEGVSIPNPVFQGETVRKNGRHPMNAQTLLSGSHVFLYRLSNGKVGGSMHGAPVLLLTTLGRKSGRKHTNPVLYARDGNRIAIVASNGGRDKDPSWWKNLRQTPEAQIRIKRDEFRVRAERASDEQKIRLWPILTKMYPGYDDYQRKTKREIPVVLLTPLNDSPRNWSQ